MNFRLLSHELYAGHSSQQFVKKSRLGTLLARGKSRSRYVPFVLSWKPSTPLISQVKLTEQAPSSYVLSYCQGNPQHVLGLELDVDRVDVSDNLLQRKCNYTRHIRLVWSRHVDNVMMV